MQISKSLVVGGVALLCLVSIPARGEDTPEEARLREALRQKMAETKASEAVAPAPSTAPEPAPVVVAPAPAVTETAPVAPAPAPVVAKPVAAPVTEPVVAPVVAAQPAPVSTPPESVAVVTPAGDDAQAARLRQVLRERMAAGTAAPVAATTELTTLPNTTVINSSTTVVAAPAPVALDPAPALPISGSKSERLAALLQQYKADQVTPQQYHEQRSKILAE